jgi:hypothetical protein
MMMMMMTMGSDFEFKIAFPLYGWELGPRTSKNGRDCVGSGMMWSLNRLERLWPVGMVEADAAGTTRCWQGNPDS